MITAKRTVDEYLLKDFYSVEENCGQKYVHVHGYFYSEGYEVVKGKPFRSQEYSGAYIPLAEFLKTPKENIAEFLDGLEQGCKDMSEEETLQAIRNYYGKVSEGKCMTWEATPMPYTELTMDTPIGDYVDMKRENKRQLYKAGDKFHISGDIGLDDYDVRVDTDGEVLMDQKPGQSRLLCTLYYVDGDCNVNVYVNVKDMKAVA